MAGYSWPKYPPCARASCTEPECCTQGGMAVWAELQGKQASEAKAAIEKQYPWVTVVILPKDDPGSFDFCCNRVFLFINSNGQVVNVPQIG
ncbi:unnamed protein product [Dovyalis caffra]|uniref:Uncharacterized protein n=1 Tax=Dovyalis caffra TaxID=77055 RepID=A0AAV1RZA0_9ROSI|nr:unnamed protein product [Dovyalis caffra]